ncbi:MAG: hypothetical protein AVDCRST_MAG53-3308, partial [uncultured Solirubrobacteraceae bacterium]
GEGSGCGQEGLMRAVLLPVQHALCAGARRALRQLPSKHPRGAAPSEPAALRLSRRAPHAGRLGLPERGGAGRAARGL